VTCLVCILLGHQLMRLAGPDPQNPPEGYSHSLYCTRCALTIRVCNRTEDAEETA